MSAVLPASTWGEALSNAASLNFPSRVRQRGRIRS